MKRIFHYQPKTLRQALLPTNLIYWIVGMGVLEYPIGHPRRIFGLIYSSTIFIIYIIATSVCYPTLIAGVRLAESSVGSLGFSVYASLFFTMTSIIIFVSTTAYKKRNDCLTELIDIDAAVRTMNDNCTYGTIFVRQIKQLLGPISFLFFIVAADFFRLTTLNDILGKIKVISLWCYIDYSTCLVAVGDMTFCTIISRKHLACKDVTEHFLMMRIQEKLIARLNIEEDGKALHSSTKYRGKWGTFGRGILSGSMKIMTQYFKDLNSLLQSMKRYTPDDCDTRMGNLIQVHTVIADKQKFERLCCIRTIHSRLVRVANLWTEVYAVHLISTVIVSVCILTFSAQGICDVFFTSEYASKNFHVNLIYHSGFLCFSLGKLYIIVNAATKLTSEAKRTCAILLEHLHPIAFIRFEVHEFALQLIQNPLRLSAGGLFDLDYSLLQMVVAAVSTYLIVLIQTTYLTTKNVSNHLL